MFERTLVKVAKKALEEGDDERYYNRYHHRMCGME